MTNETEAALIKKMATDIVMLGQGHPPGIWIAAISLAIGSYVKRTCITVTKGLELIDRIALVAKEASLTK